MEADIGSSHADAGNLAWRSYVFVPTRLHINIICTYTRTRSICTQAESGSKQTGGWLARQMPNGRPRDLPSENLNICALDFCVFICAVAPYRPQNQKRKILKYIFIGHRAAITRTQKRDEVRAIKPACKVRPPGVARLREELSRLEERAELLES
jgi:hypothetical protein